MSRDSNGNYSLPASFNPVVSGTTIDPDWANVTLDDMSAGLTDSLSRTGKGGMLAPFFLYDGVVNAPGMSWISENTSGMYRASANDFRYSINGRDVLKLSKTGLTVLGENTSSTVSDTGLKISGSGNKFFSVESTDAPANLKLATIFKAPDGTTCFGILKDDLSAFTKGIKVIPGDNLVYDIATNKPFMTDATVAGAYLPLTGGNLLGSLNVKTTSWPNFALEATGNAAGHKRTSMQLGAGGDLSVGKLNDAASAYTGGIQVGADNIVRDIRTGGTFWHTSNMGSGSGLNADLLDGYSADFWNNGNTIVIRHGGGDIVCGPLSAAGAVSTPNIWVNGLQIYRGGSSEIVCAAPFTATGTIYSGSNLSAAGTLNVSAAVVNGRVTATDLAGGAGAIENNGGTLKCYRTANRMAFRWDGASNILTVDSAFERGIETWNMCDSRLKTNVKTSTHDALSALRTLNVIEFDAPSEISEVLGLQREKGIHHNRMALMAQDLETVIPEAVYILGAEKQMNSLIPADVRSVRYTVLIPWLVKALQQLAAEVETLHAS